MMTLPKVPEIQSRLKVRRYRFICRVAVSGLKTVRCPVVEAIAAKTVGDVCGVQDALQIHGTEVVIAYAFHICVCTCKNDT
jgi:hypothetical protein